MESQLTSANPDNEERLEGLSPAQLESHFSVKFDRISRSFKGNKETYDSQNSTQKGSASEETVGLERSLDKLRLAGAGAGTRTSIEPDHLSWLGIETIRGLVTACSDALERIPLLEMDDLFWDKLVEIGNLMNQFLEFTLKLVYSKSQTPEVEDSKYLINSGLVFFVDFLMDFAKGQDRNGTRKDVGFTNTAFELVKDIFDEFQTNALKIYIIQKLIDDSVKLMDQILVELKNDPNVRNEGRFWKRELLMNYLKLLESAVISTSQEFILIYPTMMDKLKHLDEMFIEKFQSYPIFRLIVTRIRAAAQVIEAGGTKTESQF